MIWLLIHGEYADYAAVDDMERDEWRNYIVIKAFLNKETAEKELEKYAQSGKWHDGSGYQKIENGMWVHNGDVLALIEKPLVED